MYIISLPKRISATTHVIDVRTLSYELGLSTGEVDHDDTDSDEMDRDDEELFSCSPTNVVSRKQHRRRQG